MGLPFLHTDVQMPVLKNQCILFSCFPSVMRQKIQMSNTSCEEKLTAISSSVSRKNMNTNFSRPQSSVRVQERHCIQQSTKRLVGFNYMGLRYHHLQCEWQNL